MTAAATLANLWSDLDRHPGERWRILVLADCLEDCGRPDEADALRWTHETGREPSRGWLGDPRRCDWYSGLVNEHNLSDVPWKLYTDLSLADPSFTTHHRQGCYGTRSAAFADLARAWASLAARGVDPRAG